MSTLSVPLPTHLEEAMSQLVKRGYGSTKAAIARHAITQFIEDEAVFAVLRAEQEIQEGKIVRGDLRKILKKSSR